MGRKTRLRTLTETRPKAVLTMAYAIGGDPDRLEIAATHAAEVGLEVWLPPFTCD